MNYNEVKEIIKIIDKSTFSEFELRLGDAYVRMNKGITTSEKKPHITKHEPQIPDVIDEPITIIPEEKPIIGEGNIVTSPIVGTFYESPSPDKEAYVKEGDTVKKGDVLCIVEAMKVMNEITSNFDGKIAEIFVKNEQMVEYNQPLFRIVD